MRKIFFSSVFIMTFVALGCDHSHHGTSNGGGSGGANGGNISISKHSESLKYQFVVNNCDTHEHKFDSMADLCTGLQNNTLNDGCALAARADYFEEMCPGQTFNAFYESDHNSTPTTAPNADQKPGDTLTGDTFVRTITAGQGSLVLYKNPTSESASTLVQCLPDNESAISSLKDAQMGGIMLLQGTSIILKNDTSSTFTDGSNFKGTYIEIDCK